MFESFRTLRLECDQCFGPLPSQGTPRGRLPRAAHCRRHNSGLGAKARRTKNAGTGTVVRERSCRRLTVEKERERERGRGREREKEEEKGRKAERKLRSSSSIPAAATEETKKKKPRAHPRAKQREKEAHEPTNGSKRLALLCFEGRRVWRKRNATVSVRSGCQHNFYI